MNSAALVYATDIEQSSRLVSNLTATGLFQRIKPLASAAALFEQLHDQPADIICWSARQSRQDADWISRLQAHDVWHDLPLIAFAEDRQSLLDSFQLGASDALYIETDAAELSARINRHLQRWQRLVELRQTQEQLQRMALTDPLTRLGNRATFDMSIQQTAAASQRTGSPYSLLMLDLDHFKTFNDTHGHQVGDMILQRVAAAIKNAARNADICCRYGGEEMVVILPNTNAREAQVLARRIHQQIAKVSRAQPPDQLPISVSIGISCASRINGGEPQKLIEEADQALYLAKQNGRNRTERWQPGNILPLRGFNRSPQQRIAFSS